MNSSVESSYATPRCLSSESDVGDQFDIKKIKKKKALGQLILEITKCNYEVSAIRELTQQLAKNQYTLTKFQKSLGNVLPREGARAVF